MRLHVWVRGHVQGVFFRESTRREAERWGVRGWVRNLPDGRVEAVLEGEGSPVREVLKWMKRGPPRSSVEGVEVLEEPEEGLEGFTILPTPPKG